jgi:hypothetical protein
LDSSSATAERRRRRPNRDTEGGQRADAEPYRSTRRRDGVGAAPSDVIAPGGKAREWRRLVGQEAEPRTGNVVGFAARTNQGWGTAVSNHRGNGRLIENLAAGTWARGPGLDAFDTVGWPDGRAGFVLEALAALDLDATVTAMPDEVRGWITHAAAA